MKNLKNFFSFSLPQYSDETGSLVPFELDESFPLREVRRVYVLRGAKENVVRGAHCHFIEEEVFVCISGSCIARIDPDGKGKQDVVLENAHTAIFVGKNVWHEFTSFSSDAVLLCFSSTHYLPGKINYEYSYKNFLQIHQQFS